MRNGLVVHEDGTKRWYKGDQLHRENGPVVEWSDGSVFWCFNGRQLDYGAKGFWKMWELLTPEQRANPTLLRYMPPLTKKRT